MEFEIPFIFNDDTQVVKTPELSESDKRQAAVQALKDASMLLHSWVAGGRTFQKGVVYRHRFPDGLRYFMRNSEDSGCFLVEVDDKILESMLYDYPGDNVMWNVRQVYRGVEPAIVLLDGVADWVLNGFTEFRPKDLSISRSVGKVFRNAATLMTNSQE